MEEQLMMTADRETPIQSSLDQKVAKAVRAFKTFEPPEGYWLSFSGGKDSIVIKRLADMAGVKYTAHYAVTTVDPPELMRYIMVSHPDVVWDYPTDSKGKRISMWTLIADHTIPPTRQSRYCCAALKEKFGGGMVTVTGVRWAESPRRRANHGLVDFQTKPKGTRKKADQDGGFLQGFRGKEGPRMKTGRKVTCMQICLCFDTGDAVRVLAPADHKPVGIRKQFGWRVALIGMWIMFGHSHDFKSVVLPYPTNQCQGGISHDNIG